jgi:two-component system, NarL family, response regulator NreC
LAECDKPITVMVVYGMGVARAGTKLLIESDPGLEVIAEAIDAKEAGRKASGHHPDVVVIGPNRSFGGDLHTQLAIVKAVRGSSPQSRTLLMSLTGDDVDAITEGVAAGADGSIALGSTSEAFLRAIRLVAEGHGQISGDVVKKIIDRAAAKNRSTLPDKDLEILCGVAHGYTSGEIGEQLNMSARTIEGHRLEIYSELGISSRSELVAWAVAHDLFTAPVGYYAEADER